MAAELDVVVYGASGFTGRQAAAYLVGRDPALRVALAGRSRAKLEAVAAGLPRPVTVLVADSLDLRSAGGPCLRLTNARREKAPGRPAPPGRRSRGSDRQ